VTSCRKQNRDKKNDVAGRRGLVSAFLFSPFPRLLTAIVAGLGI